MNAWQCRSARDFLKLSRQELAAFAGLGYQTIVNVELGNKTRQSTLDKLEAYFTAQGIKFTKVRGYAAVHVPEDRSSS